MTRRCRLCGRVLRDPLWRARGVGRYCARRAGLVRSRQCVTVLVWSARAVEVGEGQMALFEVAEGWPNIPILSPQGRKGAAQPL